MGDLSGLITLRDWNSSDLRRTTVDKQLDSGNETGIVRCEEQRRARDLFRLSDPAHRHQRHERVFHFLRNSREDARLDRTGAYDIHSDPSGFEIVRPGAREGAHSGFACVVNARALEAFHARDRTSHDDRSAVSHERECLLHTEQRAAYVEVECFIEALFRYLSE